MANIRTGRKSGFILRSGVMRRETQWQGVQETNTILASASSAVLINSPSATLLALRPFTVVRTRGFLHVASDQVAASELYHGALGCCVVSDQAVAIGVTAVPTPITDRQSDLWFTYEELGGQFVFGSATSFMEQGVFRTYDSKAMRKVDEGDQPIFVIESSTLGGGVEVLHAGRQLIKLH